MSKYIQQFSHYQVYRIVVLGASKTYRIVGSLSLLFSSLKLPNQLIYLLVVMERLGRGCRVAKLHLFAFFLPLAVNTSKAWC